MGAFSAAHFPEKAPRFDTYVSRRAAHLLALRCGREISDRFVWISFFSVLFSIACCRNRSEMSAALPVLLTVADRLVHAQLPESRVDLSVVTLYSAQRQWRQASGAIEHRHRSTCYPTATGDKESTARLTSSHEFDLTVISPSASRAARLFTSAYSRFLPASPATKKM